MYYFHILHKWSLACECVLHTMGFDLGLYLQDFPPWVCNKNKKGISYHFHPLTSKMIRSRTFSRVKTSTFHDDFIKWKHFPRYWLFVRGIHRSVVNSPHKGQWRGALVFSLICAWINGSVNNGDAGDLRCHGAHYDVTVMFERMFAKYHCIGTD